VASGARRRAAGHRRRPRSGRRRGAETVSAAPATTSATVAAEAAIATALSPRRPAPGLDAAGPAGQRATCGCTTRAVIEAPGPEPSCDPPWWCHGARRRRRRGRQRPGRRARRGAGVGISEQRSADRIVCDLNNTRVNFNDLNAYACNSYSAGWPGHDHPGRGRPGVSGGRGQPGVRLPGGHLRTSTRPTSGGTPFDGHGRQARASVRACSTNPLLGDGARARTRTRSGTTTSWCSATASSPTTWWRTSSRHAVTDLLVEPVLRLPVRAPYEGLVRILLAKFRGQSTYAARVRTLQALLIGEDLPPDPGTGIANRAHANRWRRGQPNYRPYGQLWSQFEPLEPDVGQRRGPHQLGPGQLRGVPHRGRRQADGVRFTGLGLAQVPAALVSGFMHLLSRGSRELRIPGTCAHLGLPAAGRSWFQTAATARTSGTLRAAVGKGRPSGRRLLFPWRVVGTPRRSPDDSRDQRVDPDVAVWQMIPYGGCARPLSPTPGTHALSRVRDLRPGRVRRTAGGDAHPAHGTSTGGTIPVPIRQCGDQALR
jgi:hypothetical protein